MALDPEADETEDLISLEEADDEDCPSPRMGKSPQNPYQGFGKGHSYSYSPCAHEHPLESCLLAAALLHPLGPPPPYSDETGCTQHLSMEHYHAYIGPLHSQEKHKKNANTFRMSKW